MNMARKTVALLPSTERALEKVGANIKRARLRRNIRAELLAERAGISVDTLSAIEKGVSTVSIGAYAAVLAVLNLDNDLEMIALDEEGKKQFKEHNLKKRERATKKTDNGETDNGRE
jgi:transcriptional regulator with XRE-family HTH domain